MNDVETDADAETSETKARKPRKRNDERRIFVYRMIDGKPRELGSFPETSIGSPLERRLPVFLRELFGDGEYKAEIRKPNGHFERSIDFSIAEDEKPSRIEFEPEIENDFDEPEEIEVEIDQNINALQLQLMIEREKNKRLSSEVQTIKAGSQNEMQTTVTALEKAYEKNTELMMLMLSQAQKPQQDATTQALSMLEKSFGIVTRAKGIADELAPENSSDGGSSSMIGDAAKLIDSLGRNAGTFLPMLTNSLRGSQAAAPANHSSSITNGNSTTAVNGANGNISSLAEMFAKIPKKENEK